MIKYLVVENAYTKFTLIWGFLTDHGHSFVCSIVVPNTSNKNSKHWNQNWSNYLLSITTKNNR